MFASTEVTMHYPNSIGLAVALPFTLGGSVNSCNLLGGLDCNVFSCLVSCTNI